MSPRLTSLVLALGLALVPTSLVVADAATRASFAAAVLPLAILGALPAIAGAAAAPWVRTGRTRAESAGRGFLTGLIPMLAIAAACLVVVKLRGPATATWMLVLSVTLSLVQAAIGTGVGALIHRPSIR